MIQKLSASIFLCLWGIVSVYGNLHPVIDKDPLSIAVEAFDNQTHPYSKERIQKGNSKPQCPLDHPPDDRRRYFL